ncbi:hypothetical protein J421_4366 [Gemmatirosa kalamazoonensis]|uniref:TonB-dependent transporter Oar-like beta-barrel domain-containing protein n=1 Tax=Gemmatirosa kalamazoonensis TaxID=861299 RepID=W0RQR8_9BACT|nr:TonB-dependent receptor [Gemmatirosa kalamazoonensis]AHG91903.1 hypothetical protein J421_4366 [Gemmatirosa kalamazoonensis]
MILLRLALLLLAIASPAIVAAQTDVIRGRVTSADGTALANVRVTATSIPGSVTRETRTNARGQFQIAFPGGQGDYIMGFALVGYNFRQFEIKRTADQDVLVADARLSVVQMDTVTVTEHVQQRVGRNSRTPDVGGTEKPVNAADVPPEVQGDLAAMAASLPGVLLVPGLDGAADGFSVLGLGADQNATTLNGSPFSGANLPRDAAISATLTTSPYDVSRGGFSGGQLAIRTGSGSNYRTRGMSLVVNAPQLMWTDRASSAVGNEFTNLSLGGVASGPIVRNKAFYNVSYQLGRRSSDNASLLSAGALGLQTAGVAPDSAARFLDILAAGGVPTAGGVRANRVSDNGSLFGQLDFSPPNSTTGSAYKLSGNASWGRQSPVGGGVTQLPNASGERTNWSGGVQLGHTRYLGLLLSESNASMNVSRNYGSPFLVLPSGRVRVNSVLPDASAVQSLVFGGNQGLSAESRAANASFQNTLSWFDDANKHRLKLGTELTYAHNAQEQSSNLLGSFTFNSLADLEAGRPASFTRQLTARLRSTGQMTGSVSLGDTYRRTADLQIQYGVRLDASRFSASPAYNAEVQQTFDRRNDHVPTPLSVSPRVGFSWTVGKAREIESFAGAVRGPRAVIQGGLGLFTNGTNAGVLGSALDNTGLPSGVQQLTCVGDAAPVPDWADWAAHPADIPDRCADGSTATVFANAAPNVVLVSPDWRPAQTMRSNLSWNGSVLDARFRLRVDGSYSLNLRQQQSVDLNFRPDVRFTLADEGDRPVFVQPTSIVQETGAIASRDARVSQSFSRVTEIRSNLRSRTAQLSATVSPITRGPSTLGWSLSYTYTNVRDQISGFSSTAGNPLVATWGPSGQGAHGVTYSLRYNLLNYAQISWTGQFRSGFRYTPMIAGDVNGDGYGNDRAFVVDPASPLAAADPALAAGMRDLLANTSGDARDCLLRQAGHIAARNSCRGPWSSSASLGVTLDRARFRMPQRASVQFSLSNPLGAADLALHGSGHLRGWGQTASPDASLLYVRGFDPVARRYKYEVNQRFGATRPQFLTLRSPVSLTVTMKVDLGPTRERQSLLQNLNYGRVERGTRLSDASFRDMGRGSLPNPMSQVLRQQDSLALTSVQADSIASMNRRYTYRTDSLWTPVARWLAALPEHYRSDEAYDRYLAARRAQMDLLSQSMRLLRDLLTPEQRRKLPQSVTNYLDPRYLRFIRDGNGMYLNAGSSGYFEFSR